MLEQERNSVIRAQTTKPTTTRVAITAERQRRYYHQRQTVGSASSWGFGDLRREASNNGVPPLRQSCEEGFYATTVAGPMLECVGEGFLKGGKIDASKEGIVLSICD